MISPAAAFYLRTYGIDAKTLKASGPNGILQKYDVLAHIKANNLQKKPQTSEPAPSSGGAKKAAKKEGKAFNPADPFSQSYADVTIESAEIKRGFLATKQAAAHSYFNSQVRVGKIEKLQEL